MFLLTRPTRLDCQPEHFFPYLAGGVRVHSLPQFFQNQLCHFFTVSIHEISSEKKIKPIRGHLPCAPDTCWFDEQFSINSYKRVNTEMHKAAHRENHWLWVNTNMLERHSRNFGVFGLSFRMYNCPKYSKYRKFTQGCPNRVKRDQKKPKRAKIYISRTFWS